MDELFVHQLPELLPDVVLRSPYWRESYFFDIHQPEAAGDVVFFTMAHYPAHERMDSLQMGKVDGEPGDGRPRPALRRRPAHDRRRRGPGRGGPARSRSCASSPTRRRP